MLTNYFEMIFRKTFYSVYQNNLPCGIVPICIGESRLILPSSVQYEDMIISLYTSKRYILAYANYVHFLTTYKSISFFYVSEFEKLL